MEAQSPTLLSSVPSWDSERVVLTHGRQCHRLTFLERPARPGRNLGQASRSHGAWLCLSILWAVVGLPQMVPRSRQAWHRTDRSATGHRGEAANPGSPPEPAGPAPSLSPQLHPTGLPHPPGVHGARDHRAASQLPLPPLRSWRNSEPLSQKAPVPIPASAEPQHTRRHPRCSRPLPHTRPCRRPPGTAATGRHTLCWPVYREPARELPMCRQVGQRAPGT